MKIGVISFSETGEELGKKIEDMLTRRNMEINTLRCREGGLHEWTKSHFTSDDALIFIGSCGIAVRAIAPFIKSKTQDPAVLVIDETGKHCIALLSGHIGGANELAKNVAAVTGAEAVITTASDIHGVFAIDSWAVKNNMEIINPERIKDITSKLLAGKQVTMASDYPIKGKPPEGMIMSPCPSGDEPPEGIIMSFYPKNRKPSEKEAMSGSSPDVRISYLITEDHRPLLLIPKVLTLGIGCRKGTTYEKIAEAWEDFIGRTGYDPHALKAVTSIDLKKDEAGIREFSRMHKVPFKTYPAEELRAVSGEFSSSEFVKSVTGVDNVCERSAICASGKDGHLIAGKTIYEGITLAIASENYIVSFQ